MILSLLSGIIIGIVLALPPGPVGITAIKYGLFKGEKAGTELAFGNAMIDFLYSLITIFATSAAISILNAFANQYPALIFAFQVSIILALMAFGILNLKSKKQLFDYQNPEQSIDRSYLGSFRNRGPVVLGIAIALTNLANPTFIPSLTWVAVQVNKIPNIDLSIYGKLLFALGFGLGNFIWVAFLVKLIVRYKHRLTDTMLFRIRQFAGFTFLGFGTLLGYRLFSVIKWPEILRLVFAF